jgi:hypothetical protein
VLPSCGALADVPSSYGWSACCALMPDGAASRDGVVEGGRRERSPTSVQHRSSPCSTVRDTATSRFHSRAVCDSRGKYVR